jgi:hypothetical protein
MRFLACCETISSSVHDFFQSLFFVLAEWKCNSARVMSRVWPAVGQPGLCNYNVKSLCITVKKEAGKVVETSGQRAVDKPQKIFKNSPGNQKWAQKSGSNIIEFSNFWNFKILKKEIFLRHGASIVGTEAVSEVQLTRVTDFMSVS